MKPLALALAGLLVLTTACGGGKKDDTVTKPETGTSSQPQAGSTDPAGEEPTLDPKVAATPPSPTEKLPPAPTAKPKQVTELVGKWNGSSPANDYFVFNAKGQGKFVAGGKELWTGTAFPVSKHTYRLSWEGGDPGVTYWQVEIKDGKLIFAANQQTYEKDAKKK
ncbi:hypothetical protein [Actinocorallia longicatena]|uniref:Lipoprotein n=1 Tax=Actinocorallia longicatena TaxID=111803 RepID=A0ABP6QHK7_9ACTN